MVANTFPVVALCTSFAQSVSLSHIPKATSQFNSPRSRLDWRAPITASDRARRHESPVRPGAERTAAGHSEWRPCCRRPRSTSQSRVAPPLNPANANDERGFLGLAFHPGFNDPASPGFRTLYTYNSELIPARHVADLRRAERRHSELQERDQRMEDVGGRSERGRSELAAARSSHSARTPATTTAARSPSGPTATCISPPATAATPTTSAQPRRAGRQRPEPDAPLGKMLRIDPLNPTLNAGKHRSASPNGQYRIPTDNPFQAAGQVPEILRLWVSQSVSVRVR